MHEYPTHFMDAIDEGSRESARAVIPLVQSFTHPSSVLDVGCGSGAWLAEWAAAGVTDYLGVDGQYVDAGHLDIPADHFKAVDLNRPLDLGRRFDLVSTLEVGEHLPAGSAGTFVDTLARHGDTILFSAAIPGQGGFHHVNEQWPSYWADLFAARGYQLFDILRPTLWTEESVEFWYRQNCLIFATEEAAARHNLPPNPGGPLDVAHPALLTRETAKSPGRLFREQARETLRESPLGPTLRKVRAKARR